MTPAELEIAQRNLEIARRSLEAAQAQALAANTQVELARWQLIVTLLLTAIPVGIAIWQLLKAERMRFSTVYAFSGGPDGSWATIFNDNARGVHVSYFEIFWKVPTALFQAREEKIRDAWNEDEVITFEIAAFGRHHLALEDQHGGFNWPHPHDRAKLCIRIWVGGANRPAMLVIKDQGKKDHA
jgi:hypothetical protein